MTFALLPFRLLSVTFDYFEKYFSWTLPILTQCLTDYRGDCRVTSHQVVMSKVKYWQSMPKDRESCNPKDPHI
ncbi:MAG: hypothetical protein ACKN9O_06885 [Actinomycetota bacterium]